MSDTNDKRDDKKRDDKKRDDAKKRDDRRGGLRADARAAFHAFADAMSRFFDGDEEEEGDERGDADREGEERAGEGEGERDDRRDARPRRDRRDARKRDDAEHPGTQPANQAMPGAGGPRVAGSGHPPGGDLRTGHEAMPGESDASLRSRLDAMVSRYDTLSRVVLGMDKKLSHVDMSDFDREQLTNIQVRTDDVAQYWGQRAPRFMPGETVAEYRLRCLSPYKKFSKEWKDVELSRIGTEALDVAEAQIRADAIAAARRGDDEAAQGVLREVRTVDAAGRTHISFVGDWRTAFSPWILPTRGARVMKTRDSLI